MKNISIIFITENGLKLAKRVQEKLAGAQIIKFSAGILPGIWAESSDLIFIMAAGIVVRSIAPLLRDKRTDPAVLVLDEAGKFVVSLAGGHIGGANDRAKQIAGFLDAEAVVTTASDLNGLPSVDLWARDNGLLIEDWANLPAVGTRLVNNGALRVYSDIIIDLPEEYLRVIDPRFADLIISRNRDVYAGSPRCSITGEGCATGACKVKEQVYLRPLDLVLGIGCNSNTSPEEIENCVRGVLDEQNLVFQSVRSIATIDLKGTEPGLRAFAEKYNFPVRTFTAAELNRVEGVERSEAAFKATGAVGVAEPAALLASGANKLLVPKQKNGNVTVAIAISTTRSAECGMLNGNASRTGIIYVVGTGPGSLEHITPAAQEAIRNSDVIVGYGTYLDLIGQLLHDKEIVSTGMTQEVDRCRKAVELAQAGKTVAVVSGGDPGVYAMAGLVYEIVRNTESRNPQLPDVEVIPGISALNAAASRLGAPLMHDFACVSLSDRLTPWETIEKRLDAAAAADFIIVLYNPRSKGRAGHMDRARDIILKHRGPGTPVGIVKGATRKNERIIVTELGALNRDDIDMQTTVIIGNSMTSIWNGLMITPRGYEKKFRI